MIRIRLAAAALAVAVLAVTTAAPRAQAQTADEIIAKNIEAKGGAELLKNTNSLKMSGKTSIQGMDATMVVYNKRPNLKRVEISVMGQQMVQAFDGTTGWQAMGAMGVQDVPAESLGAARQDAEFESVFINYKEKGTLIDLVGKETLDEKPVYHLKVTRTGSPAQDYYLDAATFLEYKVEIPTPQGKVTVKFDGYQKVDGRTVPAGTTVSAGGQMVTSKMDKIEFNVPMEDSLFKKPAPPK